MTPIDHMNASSPKPPPVTELLKLTGSDAIYTPDIRGKDVVPFPIPVTIMGARESYGRTEFRIHQKGGIGQAWVSFHSVEIIPV